MERRTGMLGTAVAVTAALTAPAAAAALTGTGSAASPIVSQQLQKPTAGDLNRMLPPVASAASAGNYFASDRKPGHRDIGVIIAMTSKNEITRCSGTVVNSANGSTIWTAAHCLNGVTGHGRAVKAVFLPAATRGKGIWNPGAPIGAWTSSAPITSASGRHNTTLRR